MLALLVFAVAAVALGDLQCKSPGLAGHKVSPVFLQFSHFKRDCYGSLDGVALEEGSSLATLRDATLADCQKTCDQEDDCKSFTFCESWAQCFLKEQKLTGEEPTKSNGDCRSFFKSSCDRQRAGFTIRVASYNLYWWNAFALPENSWKRESILENIRSNLKPDTLGLQECDVPEVLEPLGLAKACDFQGAQGVVVAKRWKRGPGGFEDLKATGKWGKRYVTWAELSEEGSGARFWHFNTHWCVHSSEEHTCNEEVRFQGAQRMVQIIQKVAGDGPVLVTGDFNAQMGEKGPQHLLKSGFKLAVNEWVDSIFYSQHWELLKKGSLDSAGSDHRPIYAELRLKETSTA